MDDTTGDYLAIIAAQDERIRALEWELEEANELIRELADLRRAEAKKEEEDDRRG